MDHECRLYWPLSKIHQVIQLVRDRPILYDKRHPGYKVNSKKEAAWKQIAKIVQTKTANECKRKWNTLRIQQRRILLKESKTKDKGNVQWHAYSLLQFLIPHMEWSKADEFLQTSDYKDDEECDDTEMSFEIHEEKPLCHDPSANTHENSTEAMIDSCTEQNAVSFNQTVSTIDDSDRLSPSTSENAQSLPPNTVHASNIITINENNRCDPVNSTSTTYKMIDDHHTQHHHHHTPQSTIEDYNRQRVQPLSPVKSKSSTSNGVMYLPVQSIEERRPDSNSMSLNYFLMDVSMQMEKLNDLAQIEVKIEIQKLLLEKLRCPEFLRRQ